MLSERTRNLIVGSTILVGLGAVMYGVVSLGRGPLLGAAQPYVITLHASNANGVSNGSKIDLNGVNVGAVNGVTLATVGDVIETRVSALINGNVDIPSDATVSIGKQYVGTSYVSIYSNNAKAKPLPRDGSAVLNASPADGGLIPKDVLSDVHDLKQNLGTLSTRLTTVADDLHVLLAVTPATTNPGAGTQSADNAGTQNIAALVVRLNKTVAGLQAIVGDPMLREQIRTILTNITASSGQLKETLTNVNDTIANANKTVTSINGAATQASNALVSTQTQIVRISDNLVVTLEKLQQATNDITHGNGTTGKLVNDPRLYEALVDLSHSLKGTVQDLDFLVKKWKDEGVNLNVGLK